MAYKRNVEIFEEAYEKKDYIRIALSEKYKISKSSIDRIVSRLGKQLKGNYYDVEKDSEEEAYLLGYIMQRIVRTLK